MSDNYVPKAVPKELLIEIAQNVQAKLQHAQLEGKTVNLNMVNYHGFEKSDLDDEYLNALRAFGLTAKDIQIEIVRATADLKTNIHYHESSTAYVICLGPEETFSAPKNAWMYIENRNWFSADTGVNCLIPPGYRHGFSIDYGGELYFLSVQSPPIVDDNGKDDYHSV